jgi:hypothetical protein
MLVSLKDVSPSEADFSNLRMRIGEIRYKHIFGVLIEILKMLDLVTASVISHDGTLVASFARYRGCNYACAECANIRISSDFISKIRARILRLLEKLKSIPLDKEMRSYAKCPKGTLPNEELKKHNLMLLVRSSAVLTVMTNNTDV